MERHLFIVLAGLPGTGKSEIAEAVGRELSIPVFAKDWLEATVLQSGFINPTNGGAASISVGYELLTTLAARQLELGQSLILDSVASTESIRSKWRSLAGSYRVAWKVIECLCSDETVHRSRLARRKRGIPGWRELDWSDIQKVASYYAPWSEPRLILEAVNPLDVNLALALAYLRDVP